ncbi:UDP-glucuronosyltransferase [Gryllus bimaculatus]|nr:UDP-glucuronosyltransferase [Gryllus bimaculatus]
MLRRCAGAALLLLLLGGGGGAPVAEAGRVLGLVPVPARSHFIAFERLLKALAARGHQVDMVSHFPQKAPSPNYTDISLRGTMPNFENSFSVEYVLEKHFFNLMQFIWQGNVDSCRKMLEYPHVKELVSSGTHYDVVVVEVFGSDCGYGLAHQLGAPAIGLTTLAGLPWMDARVGNPSPPSHVPVSFLPFTPRMGFWERVLNAAGQLYAVVGERVVGHRLTDAFLQRYLGEGAPPLEDLLRNTSLVMVNSHFSLNGARATVPGYVEVGGLHVDSQPGELPEDLRAWVEGAGEGVVLATFGSLVQAETMPGERLRGFARALGALRQRVVWKVDPTRLPFALPRNVLPVGWVPQQALLSHPNVRAFVTHGGLGGVQEAVFWGVPMVVVPFFTDQRQNGLLLQERGAGRVVFYKDLGEDSLLAALAAVLDDPSYRENARRLSEQFRDRPQAPLETAVWWTEYVMRHRGAPHLRSAAVDLTWPQLWLLDVGAVLAAILVLLAAALWLTKASVCDKTKQLLKYYLEEISPKKNFNEVFKPERSDFFTKDQKYIIFIVGGKNSANLRETYLFCTVFAPFFILSLAASGCQASSCECHRDRRWCWPAGRPARRGASVASAFHFRSRERWLRRSSPAEHKAGCVWMAPWVALWTALAVAMAPAPASGGRVLAAFQLNAKSHWKTPVPNYRDVSLEGTLPPIVNNVTFDVVEHFDVRLLVRLFWQFNVHACELALSSGPVRRLLADPAERFDVVVTEVFSVDCMAGLAHRFHAPLFTDRMTLWERASNAALGAAYRFGHWYFERQADAVARRHVGDDMPPLGALVRNTSLLLVNSHFSLHPPVPMVPGIVEVAGMHLAEPRPLPKDLLRFVEGAEAGVVVFSLGSMMRSETMPPALMGALLFAFRALPQRVVWKVGREPPPGLHPDKFWTASWLPQTDLLHHPKVLAFLSHGGLLSVLEAVAAGVPLVGMPLHSDQYANTRVCVRHGMALSVDHTTLTGEELLRALRAVIQDPRWARVKQRGNCLCIIVMFIY